MTKPQVGEYPQRRLRNQIGQTIIAETLKHKGITPTRFYN